MAVQERTKCSLFEKTHYFRRLFEDGYSFFWYIYLLLVVDPSSAPSNLLGLMFGLFAGHFDSLLTCATDNKAGLQTLPAAWAPVGGVDG